MRVALAAALALTSAAAATPALPKLLPQKAEVIGGHIFVSDTRTIDRPGRNDGFPRRVAREDRTALRILRPDPRQTRWNTAMRNRVTTDLQRAYAENEGQARYDPAAPCDAAAAAAVAAAAAALIVTTHRLSWYCVGASRGSGLRETLAWSLPLGRPLIAADLFDDVTPWRAGLADIVARASAADARLNERPVFSVDDVDVTLGEPSPRIDAAGLCLRVERDSFGYEAQVRVPWATLRPWLRRDLPFDPATLEGTAECE